MKLTLEDVMTVIENFQMLVERLSKGNKDEMGLAVNALISFSKSNNTIGIKGVVNMHTFLDARRVQSMFFDVLEEETQKMSINERDSILDSIMRFKTEYMNNCEQQCDDVGES